MIETIRLFDESLLRRALARAFPTATIELLPLHTGSENRHAHIHLPGSEPLFVKMYASIDRHRTECEVLALLEEHCDFVVRPKDSGVTSGVPWQAFPLLELEPTPVDRRAAALWGSFMGQLHLVPGLPELGKKEPLSIRIPKLLAALEAFPDIQAQACALWEKAGSRLLGDIGSYHEDSVLLQNDFGPRNIYVRRDTGEMVILDFERAGKGDSHWEVGKLWDEQLHNAPEIRAAFVESYCLKRGLPQGSWPNVSVLWLIRLAAALAIFPYARRVGDVGFFRHGRFKLRLLEEEYGIWDENG